MAGRPTDVAHGACRQAGQRNYKFTKNKPNVGRLAKKIIGMQENTENGIFS